MLGGGAPAARALTPGNGESYANGVGVDGPCTDVEEQADTHIASWQVATIDPRREYGGATGGELLYPWDFLPRIEEIAAAVTDEFSANPSPQAYAAAPGNGKPCAVNATSFDAEPAGTSVELFRPGPYVFQIEDSTVHYVLVDDSAEDPQPSPCADNDTQYYPTAIGSPPTSAPSGQHWAAQGFCNKTTVIDFSVRGDDGLCPANGDMTQWPSSGYINQYDAGARLGLPDNGGSADGPSSLLMGLLNAGATATPTLPATYTATVAGRYFSFYRALAFLKSLGYHNANTFFFGDSADDANVNNLAKIYNEVVKWPALVETALGSVPWSFTGGGHVILITGSGGSNFVVRDPAGNYFADEHDHYGPGHCGYRVTYPAAWINAYIVGRQMLTFGARVLSSPRARQRASGPATAAYGTAFSVADTNPASADNPGTFYLRDAQGRRAGWIDGKVVEEIPDSYAGKDVPSHSNPRSGDPAFDPTPSAPAQTPRAIVVADPQPGTTLHVAADAAFALTAEAWIDGAVTARDNLTGGGSGQDAVVSSRALDALTSIVRPAIRHLVLKPHALHRRAMRVSFTLNVAATVRFTVERRKGKRWERVAGSFSRDARASTNTFRFNGKVRGRKLRRGSYRLVAVATAAGRKSPPARAAFSVA
jgi:hypothetical protein